jgi:glycerol kinase
MQVQADILNTRVVRPSITETTAMGAAYLAGLAIGYWASPDEIQRQWKIDRVFEPENINTTDLIKGWHRAVRAAKAWAEEG